MKRIGGIGLAAIAIVVLLSVGGIVLYHAATAPHGYGTPNSSGLPAGGITMEKALEIATRTSAAGGPVVAGATPGYDVQFGRWVWHVTTSWSGGPTAGEWCQILVDYFSGEILDRQCVVS